MSKGTLKKWKIGTIIGLFFLLCVTAVCGSSLQSFAAKENRQDEKEKKQFKISATFGVNDWFKEGRDVIADVTVTNNGEDFEGNVEIIIPIGEEEDDGKNTAYQAGFSVKKGETKTVSIPIYMYFSSCEIRIHITDQKHQIIQKESKQLSACNEDTALIGVLSDQKDAFLYLTDSDSTYNNNSCIEYFSPEKFPDSKERFDCIDYLVVDDYDTTKWSKEQYQAVTDWVKDGGLLILGTGASGEKTLAGFEKDFLDVSIKNVDKNGIAKLNVEDGKETKAMQSDVTMIKVKRDSGWIYIIPEDLALFDEEWQEKGMDYVELLGENWKRDKTGYLVTQIEEGASNQDIDNFDKGKFPSIQCYAVIFGVYAVIVSVGLFFVLKKKGRLEWRWKLVPVFAIAGSVVVYVAGTKSRITTPEMIYSRTIEYTGEGENVAMSQMNFSVASPYEEDYSMAVPEGETVYQRGANAGGSCVAGVGDPLSNEEAWEEYVNSYKIAIRKEGEQQIVRFQDLTSFESAYLGTRERKVKVNGTYSSDISCDKYEYSGTFTNDMGYDIKHAIYLAQGRVYKLGEIKSGETITISDKLKNGFSIYSSTYEDFGFNEDTAFCDYCDISRMFTGNTPVEERQYAYALANYFCNEKRVGRILEPKVIGQISSDQEEDSVCAEWGMEGSGFTLGVFPVNIKETDKEEFVGDVLAKSYGLGSVSAWNRVFEFYSVSSSTSTWREFEDEQAVYEYRLQENETLTGLYYLPVANTKKNEISKQSYPGFYYFEGEILAYNYDKKKYETIFKGTEKRGIENVEAYTGKDNCLLLKFRLDEDLISTSGINMIRLPVISATKKVE